MGLKPRCGTRRTIRSATLACLLVLLLPGCHEEATSPSPTLSLSRSPDGFAIAEVTAVVLTAEASLAGGDALAVSWDFGDGQTGSGASVTHVYAREGVYAVSVTASGSRGGVTTTGTAVTVGGLGGRWLLSGGGERFYETGFDITQAGPTLGGRPYSVPGQGLPRRDPRPRDDTACGPVRLSVLRRRRRDHRGYGERRPALDRGHLHPSRGRDGADRPLAAVEPREAADDAHRDDRCGPGRAGTQGFRAARLWQY